MRVGEILDRDTWNNTLRTLPYTHILQTWEWGSFKHITTGWKPTRLAFYDDNNQVVAMASILTRRIAFVRVMYVPKGAVFAYDDEALTAFVLDYLKQFAKKRLAIWLKIDPDVPIATGLPNTSEDTPAPVGQLLKNRLMATKWRFSDDQVQFRNTLTIDLSRDEETLLAEMSQNTRRKIRTAEKKGVTIKHATLDDLPILYDLYRITGERDQFLTRPPAYYERAWRDFMVAGLAHALIAYDGDVPIAHVILFHFGRKCWYFYGASANIARDKMPNYLLQWEAMRWAKSHGYAIYDMWGAPNDFIETDRLWGVYQFKQGFRGEIVRHIGAWDYAPYPPLYWAYTQAMPRVMNFIRRRKHSTPPVAENSENEE
ncbi:MAG: peptidoglycan bridge formation glycyltransferase FemA/FemB family protein [bacterium]|nr:peptidoglycan bridge formation glycyltransferase FemA/FemB family protein [bacterium]